ncbi:MAG TPA: peptidoglycan DD-metalloendopeptidase family protein [Nocardioides sp.]|nr:peptidoglycan DD-metalloendopeptidase family protein [Nocardioides sp.]
MKAGLLPWDGLGALVAAAAVGCAGYVGFTVAEVVRVATTEDVGVVAVADPPRPVTHPTRPAPAEAPASTPSASPSVGPLAAVAAERPARRADRPAAAAPSGRPAKGAAPPASRSAGRKVAPRAEPVTRKQELEIERALRADRQLAAMLRATPQSSVWFGGASWVLPVADYHLTARFGAAGRLWSSTHTGLDFAAPTGTPVRAATAGTVTFAGSAGAYGNKIEITHPDGTETWYAHLSRFDVRVGSQVGTGALIGAVGATGNVTGSHLHFEVRPGGDSPVDPEAALREHGVRP